MISWWPDERVNRLIGNGCFAARDKEGHDEAYAAMLKSRRRRREIEYILSQMPKLPEFIDLARLAVPISQDIDEAVSALQARLHTTLQLPA